MKQHKDRLDDVSLKQTNWITLLIALASMVAGVYFVNWLLYV